MKLSSICWGGYRLRQMSCKNGSHFEFWLFSKSATINAISLPEQHTTILSKYFTPRYLRNIWHYWKFQKMAAVFNIPIFCALLKQKIYAVFPTVRDRVISSKISTRQVSKKCMPPFKTIVKMAPIQILELPAKMLKR